MTPTRTPDQATAPLDSQRPSLESVLRTVPTQVRSKERLATIVTAVAECVVEAGSSEITLHQVAERLDCAVSSLYHFFEDNEKALLAVVLSDDGFFDSHMLGRVAALEDPTTETVIDAVWRGLYEAYRERPAWVHITLRSRNRAEIARYAEARNAQVAEALLLYAHGQGLSTERLTFQRAYLAAEAVDRIFQYAFHERLDGDPVAIEMGADMVADYLRRFTSR